MERTNAITFSSDESLSYNTLMADVGTDNASRFAESFHSSVSPRVAVYMPSTTSVSLTFYPLRDSMSRAELREATFSVLEAALLIDDDEGSLP
jgi:hypothetical protein